MGTPSMVQCDTCGQDFTQEIECMTCDWVYYEKEDTVETCPNCGNDDRMKTIYITHSEEECEKGRQVVGTVGARVRTRWTKDGKRYWEVTKYEDGKIASVRYGWKLEEVN